MDESKLFSKKMESNLKALERTDLKSRAGIIGGQWQDDTLWIDFFNRRIGLCLPEFIDRDNLIVTDAVKSVLTGYVLNCPLKVEESSSRLISFREFENAGPLLDRFHANTSKTIESHFSGRIGHLEHKCIELGGKKMETSGFDLSIRFRALPRLPFILLFNDADEAMPAASSFLFHDNAAKWLNLDELMVITTFLTGSLICDPGHHQVTTY